MGRRHEAPPPHRRAAVPDRRHRGARALRRGQGRGGDRHRPHRRQHARAGAARVRRAQPRQPRARPRRASRPRAHRPHRVPDRHGRGRADLDDGGAALRRGPGRLPRRAHAARRDGRSGERGRDGRHRDHDRHGDPAGGRQPGGSAGSRRSPGAHGGRRPRDGRPRARVRPGRDRRSARDGRRRADHQAREPDHRPGGGAGRVGHPPRAGDGLDARPSAHRRRAERGARSCRGRWSPAS